MMNGLLLTELLNGVQLQRNQPGCKEHNVLQMLNLSIFMKIEYLMMLEKNPMSMKFCPNLSA